MPSAAAISATSQLAVVEHAQDFALPWRQQRLRQLQFGQRLDGVDLEVLFGDRLDRHRSGRRRRSASRAVLRATIVIQVDSDALVAS